MSRAKATNVTKEPKEPKRYECLNSECGFISNRTKSIKFPGITFGCCFKCRGKIKEREEWLTWLYEQRERIRKDAIENHGGMIIGRKIN
ncbi:hypothetical protein GZH47_32895 (plasmid) [Paenibacillus rhizovicinus]|uniref:Uncharacterized protein n=1 Tax=Paenibacillus rhizovicinus TaxID=2704463 RepID=A0A6C0PCY2_9BACL|nr:hypothetical protein [Paenibacillus rhizovicinus]QHW35692.1 hypothetical protein GZH47_32895 [Paenibacillus rhizovicinus]